MKPRPAAAYDWPQTEPREDTAEGLTWRVPAGWVATEDVPDALLADYRFPGTTQSLPGRLTVSRIPGDAGGLEANVGRWGQQFFIFTPQHPELAHRISPVLAHPLGSVQNVEMYGQYRGPTTPYAMAAAVVTLLDAEGRAAATWFFKMTGDEQTVRGQGTKPGRGRADPAPRRHGSTGDPAPSRACPWHNSRYDPRYSPRPHRTARRPGRSRHAPASLRGAMNDRPPPLPLRCAALALLAVPFVVIAQYDALGTQIGAWVHVALAASLAVALAALYVVRDWFASLRLTVTLLALWGVLIFLGTLAQTERGIWDVVGLYFRSMTVFVPLDVFRPLSPVALSRPIPQAYGFWFPAASCCWGS